MKINEMEKLFRKLDLKVRSTGHNYGWLIVNGRKILRVYYSHGKGDIPSVVANKIVTIYCRWRMGENLMQSHRSHLYQYMCNELAIPHWKVSSLYAMVQLILGVLSLFAYSKGLILQFTMLGIFFYNIFYWYL